MKTFLKRLLALMILVGMVYTSGLLVTLIVYFGMKLITRYLK